MTMGTSNILELDEKTLYVEADSWRCDLPGGNTAKLGIVFEAVDLARTGRVPGDEEYSLIVEAQIVPQPEYLDEEIVLEASEEEVPTRKGIIGDVYRYYGGVPVNIDAAQPARASCGVSSFVTDQVVHGEMTESGMEIEVRPFKSVEDALSFTREFYALAASMVFEFLDWVLDQPLGRESGWEKIGRLTTGG